MGRLSGERRVALSRRMIQRLNEIKRERDLSFDQFKIAISAPFTSQTLYHAMTGKPLWESNYAFLAEFVRKHTRPSVERDGKAAAAGDTDAEEDAPTSPDKGSLARRDATVDERDEETAGAAGTVRGSR